MRIQLPPGAYDVTFGGITFRIHVDMAGITWQVPLLFFPITWYWEEIGEGPVACPGSTHGQGYLGFDQDGTAGGVFPWGSYDGTWVAI